MQNSIQKFRQSSIVFQKPGILSENLKILTTLNYLTVHYWNSAHISYLPMSTKGCAGFFLFCLYLELFAKIKKDVVSKHSFFTFLLITQINKQNKQNPEHAFVGIIK